MKLLIQTALRTLSNRDQLGPFLNGLGLTGKGVEVGTLYGTYAADLLKKWNGHLYCVDPWKNQERAVYFDGANLLDMNAVFAHANSTIGANPRCTLLRMMSIEGAGQFEDGELDFVNLDGNHAVDAVRADISAWWPKVKIGGIFCGHDCNTRYDHETNSDAATAVFELCEAINVRPHLTWCTSWFIQKTEEVDRRFREACAAGRFSYTVHTDNTHLDCVVVIPVARFDWNLAVKMLKWWAAMLGGQPNYFATIAWCSPALTNDERDALGDAGVPNFMLVVAEGVKEIGYFGTPNQMFKGALEYCERTFPGRAVLWAEADTVPTHLSWVSEIQDEYRACGRPFMGDIVRAGAIPHLTGVAVYHPNWKTIAPSIAALGSEECGWDSLCSHETLPRAHAAKTIQQFWRPPLPITAAWAAANIRRETALFHQCKDGSLIDVLCLDRGIAKIALDAPLCASSYDSDKAKRAQVSSPAALSLHAEERGGVHILVVSCKRDIDFLDYCLKSIRKFARGFSGVTLAVPVADARAFAKFERLATVTTFDEVPGKGMLHHMIPICRADEMCPKASAIMHIDSDVIAWQPFTPEDYMPGGKCLMVREHYSGITNQNRHIWAKCVERAVGIVPEYECMVRHPNIYPRALYGRVRQLVELHTGKPFDEYVLSCENGFPQSFAEFPTLGAVAIRDFSELFHFVEYNHDADALKYGVPHETPFQYLYVPGRDKVFECWSHGGIGRYRNDLAKFMRGELPAYFLK